ncbi:MAG TPA: toll/interleukin-1 receptor domain-containing protein [Thermoanaerobaculia bacterium]|nr:toll/interleukin-1 receptor domain-containing protein [Thermoanaerobaculia bacterium]
MSHRTTRAFISYTWDSEKQWVKDLAARLRSAANVDVALDEWEVRPGDQLTHFMERAIRESDFVLCICTPRYKERFDARQGGAGYEANLISAEALATGNERKFVGLLRMGEPLEALPGWLLGKRFLDFRGDPYAESSYESLVATIHGLLPQAPPLVTSGFVANQLQPTSVARQDSYAEFLNAALKVIQQSQSRLILRSKNNEASRILLPDVEAELEKQLARVTDLMHTYALQSSDEVKKAAGPITAFLGMLRLLSWLPNDRQKFDEISATLVKEYIPKFVEAARKEGGLR